MQFLRIRKKRPPQLYAKPRGPQQIEAHQIPIKSNPKEKGDRKEEKKEK